MPGSITVRPPMPSDAEALATLVGQLGYPASSDEMPERLRAVVTSGRAVVLVAEVESAVVGLATAHLLSTIHSPVPVALLTVLVVAEAARGGGVGRALVARAEAWARTAGAARISVTSGAQREAAHAFYERIGYVRTGVRFGKAL